MLRYCIYDGDELIRKVSSRIECEPYIQSGCTFKVLPKIKDPTPSQLFLAALETVGEATL